MDYPTYGSTFEEDFAARRRMLPQAMGAAMPAQPRGAYDPETQLEELMRQRAALEQQQPDMSAMQEFARRQGEMGQGALLNALAAQYAGEGFQPLQAKFLKRAEAAQQPMKVGGGILTPTGEFVRDPMQAQERQAQSLERRIGETGRLVESRRAREAMLEQRRSEQAQRADLAQQGFDLRREIANLARAGGQGGTPRFQQSDSFMLPNGSVVIGMFNPQTGQHGSVGDDGQFKPFPSGTRPINRGAGGPLNAAQYNELIEKISIEESSLTRLNRYFESLKSSEQGFKRLADQIAAKARTAFGSPLTQKQLAAQVAKGQLEGLLGLFRIDVVGPGVMTEPDARRVEQALGGRFDLLQDPQTVERLLRDIYEDKQRRIGVYRRQANYSAPAYPGLAPPADSPVPFGAPAQGGGQQPAPERRRIRLDSQGNPIQ